MTAPRLFFRMDARLQTLGWTAAVWLTGILGILLTRRADQGRWLARIEASILGATLREVVVFLYCVAAPAVLLIAGVISRDGLGDPDGQTLTDWLRGAGIASSAAVAAVVTLRLAARSIGAVLPGAAWTAARDALYFEMLWAFLRSAPANLLADPYWGAILGIAFGLGLFAALGRFNRPRSPAAIGQLGVDLACLLASALVFFATRNLPLCIGAHMAIRLGASAAAIRAPQTADL
jgi:hypothetical protein